jgi:hypothetical protein
MNYFDNLDMRLSNKYKKNYRYILLLIYWKCFKFHSISLSFVSPSKTIKFLYNLQWFQFNSL